LSFEAALKEGAEDNRSDYLSVTHSRKQTREDLGSMIDGASAILS